jgi:hypothetical protein
MFTINKPKFNHLLIIAASLIAQNTQANGDLKPLKDSIYSQVQIIPNLPEFKEPINNPTSPAKQWFEKISLGGYVQFRYNRLFETNPNLKCEQCDRSIGENGGFFIRRNRLRVAGQIHPRLYMYIQYDFASAPSATAQHYGQIRDAYFDLGLDDDNEFRLRFGQSKTPYGFINMQSSQNRLNLDRDDALNSGSSNEREIGVFAYWAPKEKRELFESLVKDGLKGSGDYGCFAYGVYNGQNANKLDENDNLHQVTRFTWPFQYKNQIFEPGIQAYTGQYTVTSLTKGVKFNKSDIYPAATYLDQRVAGTMVVYPKPFGLQAEYNVGRGPQFNKFTDSIEVQNLNGGYVMVNYMIKTSQKQIIHPFARYTYYKGGKKHELDARSYEVKELEFGIEWIPFKNFELVCAYNIAERRYEDFVKQDNLQTGRFMRLQAQLNF